MKQLYYAIQNIIRGRGANLIKTLSLSLGLVVSVLLFSQIAFELSYERCYPQMERLAMAQIRVTGPQGMDMDKTVPAPLANALMEDLAGSIQSATTIFPRCNDRIYKDNELMKANFHGIYADTLYFSTFGIDVVKGDPHWLATPGATFVSESFAREVFGGEDPVGRKLSLDKVEELTVRGVYRDVPRNTFLPHDFVISNRDGDHIVWDGTWNRNDMYFCILRLKSVADYEVVNRRIQRIVEKHIKTEHDNYRYDYGILPLSDYHTSDPDTRQRLLILGVLGFAIFFVSVMNYVLISIANVEGKALEKEGDILVNQELVKLMKWTDGAIGKKLEGLDGSIIGVIKDIRNTTFFRRQPPIALVADSKRLHIYNVRLKEPYDKNLRELNRFMEQTYSQYALEFHSMNDVLGEVYEDVYRFRNSVCIVSLFILLIVLMGLIGYVSDETQRRSKEIAIRKVNGAEVSHILFLLIKEIIGMALPAVVLGVVAADYISGLWLQQFKDTPHFGWLPFVGTALVVMLIIIQCVVIRAWRIAAENPVKSIKSE